MISRQRKILNPKQILRCQIFLFNTLIIFGGLSFMIIVLWLGSFYIPFLRITKIDISGNQELSGDLLEEVVRQTLSEKIIFNISKDSFFLFSTHTLEKKLSKIFPKISEIDIDRRSFSIIEIEIKERKFTGLWCNTDQTNCYLVDQVGLAYEKYQNPDLTNNLLILKNQKDIKLFNAFSSKGEYTEILSTVSFLFAKGFPVDLVEVKDDSLSFYLRGGGKILLGLDFYNTLLNKFVLLQKEYDWQSGSDFEYIDLRFSGKAFVK